MSKEKKLNKKVYSVRLKSLNQISDKCWKAEDWQGNTFLIPDSQYFGRDYDVIKSDAYWIASWIIDKEDCHLQVSTKKIGWYDPKSGRIKPPVIITIEHHVPERIAPIENNTIKKLKR